MSKTAYSEDIKEFLKNPSEYNKLAINNNISDEDWGNIIEVLQTNSSVKELIFYNTCMGDLGAKDLVDVLKTNTVLSNLSIEGNKIGAAGAKDLAEALKTNRALTSLNLQSNNIGAAGAKDLAEALKTNRALTSLNLQSNNIGAAGAKDLAEALKTNRALTSLNLQSNNIGAAGVKDLTEALKINTVLTKLDVWFNNIGAVGAKFMIDALAWNNTIVSLEMSCDNNDMKLLSQSYYGFRLKTVYSQDCDYSLEKIISRNYEILNRKLEKEFADLSINPDKAADKEPLISLKWPLYYLSCFDPNSNIKKLSSDDNSHQSYFSSKEDAKNYCLENFFRLLGVSKSYELPFFSLPKELIIKISDECFKVCNFVFTTSRNYCSDLKKAEQLAIDNAHKLTSEVLTSISNNHDITDSTEVGLSGADMELDS